MQESSTSSCSNEETWKTSLECWLPSTGKTSRCLRCLYEYPSSKLSTQTITSSRSTILRRLKLHFRCSRHCLCLDCNWRSSSHQTLLKKSTRFLWNSRSLSLENHYQLSRLNQVRCWLTTACSFTPRDQTNFQWLISADSHNDRQQFIDDGL